MIVGRVIVAETFGTASNLRVWAGTAAQTGVTAMVLAVVWALVETASTTSGDAAGALRSFSTPGALAGLVTALLVSGGVARLAHESLVPIRRRWLAAGIGTRTAGAIITAQVSCTTMVMTLVGVLAAWVAVRSMGQRISVGSHVLMVAFGIPTVVTTLICGTLLALPAVRAGQRSPWNPVPHRLVRGWLTVVIPIAGAIWTAGAIISTPASDSISARRAVGLTLLLLVLLVLAAPAAVALARRMVARLLVRLASVGTAPAALGVSRAARTLRRSSGTIGPTLVAVSIAGGSVAAFRAGDTVVGSVVSTVNTGAIVLTLAPVIAIAVCASVVISLVSSTDRRQEQQVMRSCGFRSCNVVAVATVEAATHGVLGSALSLGVVSATVAPMALATHQPLITVCSWVCNPVELLLLGAVAVVMLVTNVATNLGSWGR